MGLVGPEGRGEAHGEELASRRVTPLSIRHPWLNQLVHGNVEGGQVGISNVSMFMAVADKGCQEREPLDSSKSGQPRNLP